MRRAKNYIEKLQRHVYQVSLFWKATKGMATQVSRNTAGKKERVKEIGMCCVTIANTHTHANCHTMEIEHKEKTHTFSDERLEHRLSGAGLVLVLLLVPPNFLIPIEARARCACARTDSGQSVRFLGKKIQKEIERQWKSGRRMRTPVHESAQTD